MMSSKAEINTSGLVIFDIDGTLFQTACVTVPAVRHAFVAFGLTPPSSEAICSFFGKPVEDYEAWLAGLCPAGIAEELVDTANALELRYIREYGKLYPGAREVLSELKARGYALALCSNGPEPYVETFVRDLGLGDLFEEVYARGTRYADKEEMVGLILKRLDAHRFVLVGDRREDIEAAHTHGGFGIAAVYGFGNPDEWHGADACIHSIREAPGHINALLGSPCA